ncbi:MAG: family 16 glycoside hydrolase [Planctomycetota bacterium]
MVFCVVEQQEPHAGQMAFADVPQPTTFAGRCALARRIRDELEVPLPIWVDGMDDASRALFSDLPSPAFVVDRQGRIVDKQAWTDPAALRASIEEALAADPLPSSPGASLTVDERDAIARRMLAHGRPAEALRWLDAAPEAPLSVPDSLVALARAALARCAALRDADAAQRQAAVRAARAAIAAAWPGDRGRAVAAFVELAEAATGSPLEPEAWRTARAQLDERAPEATRAWLRQRLETAVGVATRGDWIELWNGRDLGGWHGQRHFDPYALDAMSAEQRAAMRAEDDATLAAHWRVEDRELVNDGHGAYLTTDRDFGDLELELEYRTVALADSGIYLRGTPQVQIWDTTEAGGKWHLGADKGSGGLWNNQQHANRPLVHADRPFGEWNAVRIVQVGARTSVWLNGKLVVDWTIMENYWRRDLPLRARGPVQLQTHGGEIRFRGVRCRELAPSEADALLRAHGGEGFQRVFDGRTLDGWQGASDSYEVVDGAIRCRAGHGGTLFTAKSYADFDARLRFRLPPGGNNGLAIRYPGSGDAAYDAVEIQVLDDGAEQYAALKPWQYHGSLYGLVPAHRGYLRPVGEWNFEQVSVRGSRITVELNGTVIVDADLAGIDAPSSRREHPGRLRTEGHFGFCGHDDPVEFRDIELRDAGR